MNSLPCKVIEGKGFNLIQNKNTPLDVFIFNWKAIEDLRENILIEYPRVCFVGASCMYPDKEGALREEMLGTGAVYPGNALYSYMKLLGWQLCQAASKQLGLQYFVMIPSDIFGEPTSTHFITEMMKKFHIAKCRGDSKVSFYGTGAAIRHPIFKDDYQRILKKLCETYQGTDTINIAPPVSFAKSVASIANDIQEIVGFTGQIEWDTKYPDGQMVKILDNTRLTNLGFTEFTPFKESLEKAYHEIKNHL